MRLGFSDECVIEVFLGTLLEILLMSLPSCPDCSDCLQIEKGRIWTFEQEQALGFSSVATNTRMTVIKLKSGGLWVHAPIAPTEECIQVLLFSGAETTQAMAFRPGGLFSVGCEM